MKRAVICGIGTCKSALLLLLQLLLLQQQLLQPGVEISCRRPIDVYAHACVRTCVCAWIRVAGGSWCTVCIDNRQCYFVFVAWLDLGIDAATARNDEDVIL